MDKDELLIRPGEICSSIYYLISGAVFPFNYLKKEAENILDLQIDSEWFSNYKSCISQNPSDSFIKAYTEIRLPELPIIALHKLTGKSPAFLQLGKIFEQAILRVHFF